MATTPTTPTTADGVDPVVRVESPAGGPMWMITDPTLARSVLADPRIVKDTAQAPDSWVPERAGLEPTAAERLSLTTADGDTHSALRRAHAPLFTPRRMREYAPRAQELATALLTAEADAAGSDGASDLVADFTARYPATVVLDVLGAPLYHVDGVITAVRAFATSPEDAGAAQAQLLAAGAAALSEGPGQVTRADELAARMPDGTTPEDVRYALFGLLLAGQITTEVVVADVVAAALAAPDDAPESLVERTLRRHPPAAVTLWRFTATEVELAGHVLPARSPVLVDLRAVCAAGADMAFGAGPHVCIGAALARTELVAVVHALRSSFPYARLAAGATTERAVPSAVVGAGPTSLPASLRPGTLHGERGSATVRARG